jgi:hypothetical protein
MNNYDTDLVLVMTTSSTIVNNVFISSKNETASSDAQSVQNTWCIDPPIPGTNIIGGPYLGKNIMIYL